MPEPPRSSLLTRITNVRPDEWLPLGLAFLFHFCLFMGYYVLRPIRDEIGAAHADVLEHLWTATFLVLLIGVPVYAVIIARMRRHIFLPLVYLFLVSNLIVFYVVWRSGDAGIIRASERVFYVWTSAINLFAVSIFWGFMADLFRPDQGRRLFGPIAMGASLGAIVGSASVVLNVRDVGRTPFLLVSAGLLVLAAVSILPLHFLARRRNTAKSDEVDRTSVPDKTTLVRAVGRSFAQASRGLSPVLRSPYLLGIAGFIFLLTLGNSFLAFEKSHLTNELILNRAERTEFMARIDLYTNLATLLVQGFVIGRLMKWIGVGGSLSLLPMINLIGFTVLGGTLLYAGDIEGIRAHASLILTILIVFEITQRLGRYAIARPSREVLFTVVDPAEKYQSKPFIDTVVYRGGDLSSAWAFTGLLKWVGLSLGAIPLVVLPAFAGGALLSFWLGFIHKRRAPDEAESL